ncbi:unnamed protein product [Lota lota]
MTGPDSFDYTQAALTTPDSHKAKCYHCKVASLGVTTIHPLRSVQSTAYSFLARPTNVQMYYEMIETAPPPTAKLAVIWVGALLLALPELLIRQLLPDTLYVLGLTYEGARLCGRTSAALLSACPRFFTIAASLVTARKIRRAERAVSARGNKKQIRLESQMNCTVVGAGHRVRACVVPENICNIAAAYMAAALAELESRHGGKHNFGGCLNRRACHSHFLRSGKM